MTDVSKQQRVREPRFGLIAGQPGKCAVAMWQGGSPSGTCGEEAFGEQYDGVFLPVRFQRPNHPPLAMGYCCVKHGGPSSTGTRFMRDGDQWCAFRPGFENLQESIAGFGLTQVAAHDDMARRIADDITARRELPTKDDIIASLLNGCNALLGLLQLLANRDDINDEVRACLTSGHRIDEAKAAALLAAPRAGEV